MIQEVNKNFTNPSIQSGNTIQMETSVHVARGFRLVQRTSCSRKVYTSTSQTQKWQNRSEANKNWAQIFQNVQSSSKEQIRSKFTKPSNSSKGSKGFQTQVSNCKELNQLFLAHSGIIFPTKTHASLYTVPRQFIAFETVGAQNKTITTFSSSPQRGSSGSEDPLPVQLKTSADNHLHNKTT